MRPAAAHAAPALRPSLTVLSVGLLAVLAYANTLTNPFVWDDIQLIEQPTFLHELANAPRLVGLLASQDYFRVSGEFYYRPFVTLSYIFDWALWGGSPAGFHLTNALLHACAAMLVVLAARQLLPLGAAWFAGALFAVHPIHAEAVSLVTGRVDLWPTVWALAAFVLFLHARHAGRAWPWLPCAVAAYGFAVLSKEIAFTLPAVLLLWDAVRLERPRLRGLPRVLPWHVPFWVVAAGYAWVRFVRLDPPGPQPAYLGGDLPTAVLSTVPIAARYLRLWVWPDPLTLYHNTTIVSSPFSPIFLASAAILMALTAVLWRIRTRAPLALAGWAAWWILLSPVMNLVPINNPIAERYVYLPTVALSVATAGLAWPLVDRARSRPAERWLAGVILCGVLAALGARTVGRNMDYGSEFRLYEQAARAGNERPDARFNFGLMAQRAGNLEVAEREYQAAIALDPEHHHALASLAEVLYLQDQASAALPYIERAIASRPESWRARYDHGLILQALDRTGEAIAVLERTAEMAPGSAKVRLALVRVLVTQGRLTEARARCAQPLPNAASEPEFAVALADVCDRLGALTP